MSAGMPPISPEHAFKELRYLLTAPSSPVTRHLEGNSFDEENFRQMLSARSLILGAGSDLGSMGPRGAQFGPGAIRRHFNEKPDLCSHLTDQGIMDLGDIVCSSGLLHDDQIREEHLEALRKAAYDAPGDLRLPVSVQSILERVLTILHSLNPGARILLVGGDHSLTLSALRAYTQSSRNLSNFGIVDIDAHADCRPEDDRFPARFDTWAFHAEKLLRQKGTLCQIGLRRDQCQGKFAMSLLGLFQIGAVETFEGDGESAIDKLVGNLDSMRLQRIYLTHDIDATDRNWAAATGVPEAYGLNPSFVVRLIARLGSDFEIVGSDLMEVAPHLHRGIPGEPARTLETASYYLIEQLKAMLKGAQNVTNPFLIPDPSPIDLRGLGSHTYRFKP